LANRLARSVAGEEGVTGVDVERWVGRGVLSLLMLFVLVAFFQALGLTLITEPLNRLLNQIFQFAPQLAGVGLLLLTAWIVASLLKLVISRVLTASRIDERLSSQVGLEEEQRGPRVGGLDSGNTVQRLLKARITLEREGPAHSAGLFLFP
jgi:hypothetical protein